jgi:hypothetical protein
LIVVVSTFVALRLVVETLTVEILGANKLLGAGTTKFPVVVENCDCTGG